MIVATSDCMILEPTIEGGTTMKKLLTIILAIVIGLAFVAVTFAQDKGPVKAAEKAVATDKAAVAGDKAAVAKDKAALATDKKDLKAEKKQLKAEKKAAKKAKKEAKEKAEEAKPAPAPAPGK
jgi:hypothetical protein